MTENLTIQAKLGYRDYDRTWENDLYPDSLALASESGVEQQIIPGDISFSLKHGDGNLFTFGYDFQYASYKTHEEAALKSTLNDADSSQHGLFVQEELLIGDLLVRLGGRYTRVEHDIELLSGGAPGNDSESWNEFLWSAGLLYPLTDRISIYTNAGTSFMAPGLKSVGGTLKPGDRGVPGMNGQLPNPDLEPEKGLGTDVGIDVQKC